MKNTAKNVTIGILIFAVAVAGIAMYTTNKNNLDKNGKKTTVDVNVDAGSEKTVSTSSISAE